MRLKYLLHKEFSQIRRNTFIARAILLVPIVQLLFLVPAVTFDIKNIRICVIDRDSSPLSRELTGKLQGSPFFKIEQVAFSQEQAMDAMHRGKVDAILTIPTGFERDLIRSDAAKLQLQINGISGTLAQNTAAYFSGLIRNFNRDIVTEYVAFKPVQVSSQITVHNRFWYNPELDYHIYMAPGILVILVTAVGFLLSGLNLVREKEIGTSEQINVTPIKKHEFILGKMIPFMIIGMIDLAFGLFLARVIYGMPLEGNLFLLFAITLVYLIAVMGLGLFLSTFASTQQQYLFICFFFMIVFNLMSGIFTPAESMPDWAQKINLLNPTAHLIRVIRMILLKGSGFNDIRTNVLLMGMIAVMTTFFASVKYKKTA